MTKVIIGIDEAGRGPLAGPVVVGAVKFTTDNPPQADPTRSGGQRTKRIRALLPVIKDSKQLSEKRREEIFTELVALAKTGDIEYAVSLVPAKYIDTHGIVPAIKKGIARVLKQLADEPSDVEVLLDGGLKAPLEFTNQQTFIKGDATHLPIALASIVAKVTRDRHMVRQAKHFPGYGFEGHKGYGTKAHYEAIGRKGLSAIHRKSFIQG